MLNKKIKIVADSSSDVLKLSNASFCSAALKIITKDKEFVDDENLDVNSMVTYLGEYNGKPLPLARILLIGLRLLEMPRKYIVLQ